MSVSTFVIKHELRLLIQKARYHPGSHAFIKLHGLPGGVHVVYLILLRLLWSTLLFRSRLLHNDPGNHRNRQNQNKDNGLLFFHNNNLKSILEAIHVYGKKFYVLNYKVHRVFFEICFLFGRTIGGVF